MLKIVDVDWLEDFKLKLTFSDGFCGEVDLKELFQKPAFKSVSDFKRFALRSDGSLDWEGVDLPASTLRELAKGSYVNSPTDSDKCSRDGTNYQTGSLGFNERGAD